MPGLVLKVLVATDDQVAQGDTLGQVVERGQVLVEIETRQP